MTTLFVAGVVEGKLQCPQWRSGQSSWHPFPGWRPCSSLETLKTSFNVSSDAQGSHPDVISQDDCPARHWRRWRQTSTSPVTTRAVILTIFPFLWKRWSFCLAFNGLMSMLPWIPAAQPCCDDVNNIFLYNVGNYLSDNIIAHLLWTDGLTHWSLVDLKEILD